MRETSNHLENFDKKILRAFLLKIIFEKRLGHRDIQILLEEKIPIL